MWNNQNNKKLFSLMSNLQTYYHFKLDFQKVDQHTVGKWLIHGTKRHKDNQLQSMELPCRISYINPTGHVLCCLRLKLTLKKNSWIPVE